MCVSTGSPSGTAKMRANDAGRGATDSVSAGSQRKPGTGPSGHATQRPPGNAGSVAPPPATITAIRLPARTPARSVDTEPGDGPHRNRHDAGASRRERASSASRPKPGPSTT
jgi:hypothetical protein